MSIARNTIANVVDFSARRRGAVRHASGSKPKVLFVDDEERILNSMRALFRVHYDVVTATDGYHALELLKRDRFQLLVSDQRMPAMLGIELLRQARESSPNTVRILLTGFSDLAAIVGSVNDGEVYRFINKPWDNQELLGIVADAVRIGVELADTAAAAPVPVHVPGPVQMPMPAPAASAAHGPAMRAAPEAVIVLDCNAEVLCHVCAMMPSCDVIPARDAGEALEIMAEREIGIIVSGTEGRHADRLSFLSLLKREHPQVITIIIAHTGDSESVIDFINHARIFRYLFNPLRPGLLDQYLRSALIRYRNFKATPRLLLQQRAAPPSPAVASTPVAQALVSRMRGLKSFFARA